MTTTHAHDDETIERWVPGPQVAPVGWIVLVPITLAIMTFVVYALSTPTH